MGTFLKYVVYLLILVVLFIVVRGFYTGSINSSTTVGNVASQINDDARTMAGNAASMAERAVDDARQARQHQ